MKLKRVVAVALVISMFGAITACKKKDKNKDEIYSTVTEYTEALIVRNSDTVNDLSDYDKSEKDTLEAYVKNMLSFQDCSSMSKDIYKAIMANTTYTTSKKNIEVNDKRATMDVVISMPDYEAVADEDYTDVEEIKKAIEEIDKKEFTIKVKLNLNKRDVWSVSNTPDVIDRMYAFEVENPFTTLNIANSVEGFANGILASDSKAICANVEGDSDDIEEYQFALDYMFDFNNYGEEGAIYSAIIDTFKYSVDYSKMTFDDSGDVTVNVDFTMVDYDLIMNNPVYTKFAEDFISVIPTTAEKTVSVKLVLFEKKGVWVIDEDAFENAIDDIYEFYSSVKLVDPVKELISSKGWSSTEHVYNDCLVYSIDFSSVVTTPIYYTITANGNTIFTSTSETPNNNFYDIYFYASSVEAYQDATGCFKPGEYTITVFDAYFNEVIATETYKIYDPYTGGQMNWMYYSKGNYLECDISFTYKAYGNYVVTFNGSVIDSSSNYYCDYEWIKISNPQKGTYAVGFYAPDGSLVLSGTYDFAG